MKKKLTFTFTCIILCLCMAAAAMFAGCSSTNQGTVSDTASKTTSFSTPRERLSQEPQASPEWVTKLDAAKDAKQLFVVAGYERSTAWISMHEKDENGNWKMLTSTPGFIGKEGLGKTKEGDGTICKCFYRSPKKKKAAFVVNFFNNHWGTNFPQWIEGDYSFEMKLFEKK